MPVEIVSAPVIPVAAAGVPDAAAQAAAAQADAMLTPGQRAQKRFRAEQAARTRIAQASADATAAEATGITGTVAAPGAVATEAAGTTPGEPKPERKSAAWTRALTRETRAADERRKAAADLAAAKTLEATARAQLEAIAAGKKDPLALLRLAGLQPEDVTNAVVNGGPTAAAAAKQLQAEIEKVKAQQTDFETRQLEAQKQATQQQIQATLRGYETDLSTHIAAAKEADGTAKYPMITGMGADRMVAQHVYDHAKRTRETTGAPVILTHDEAATAIEGNLFKQFENFLEKHKAHPRLAALVKLKFGFEAPAAKPRIEPVKASARPASTVATAPAAPKKALKRHPDAVWQEIMARRGQS